MAIYCLTCSAKGISSHDTIFGLARESSISSNQLGKELGISQKSAWFILHRLREVLNGSQKKNMFCGTVETETKKPSIKKRRSSQPKGAWR